MIARKNCRRHGLDKTTLMTFRVLARKGTDAQLEDFLYKVAQYYIAEVRDTDFVDPEEYLKVTGTAFEAVCPYCGNTIELDLEGVIK